MSAATADDPRPLTRAQVGRIASHIKAFLPHEGLSGEAKEKVVAARREIAEALGLVRYRGKDTDGGESWREPRKVEGES